VIGRRKELPEGLRVPYQAFLAVLEQLEPAKAGIADVLPTTRLPGRPLRDAVEEYRDRLARAQPLMPAWRREEVQDEWEACARGLDEARSRADHLLALSEDPVGFDGLLGTIEQLLDPLDPFGSAAERFLHLRRRGGRKN
jgi:predicted ATPase